MSFFQFCDKLQGFIGLTNIIRNIDVIYNLYKDHKTIGEVVDIFEKLKPAEKII